MNLRWKMYADMVSPQCADTVGVRPLVLVLLATMLIGSTAPAALIETSPIIWNESENYIKRNGAMIESELMETNGYRFLEETADNTVVAHTGNGAVNGALRQDVFARALPESNDIFEARNVVEQTRTLVVTPEEAKRQFGMALVTANVVLNGGIEIFADSQGSFHNSQAQVDIEVTYDFDFWGRWDRVVKIPVFRGSMRIMGLPNGKAIHYTTGMINARRDITHAGQNGDEYAVSFDNVRIPFRTFAQIGCDYKLTTKITSYVKNGETTFEPDEPVPPIPEPAGILLMGLGGWLINRRRCR